MKTSDNAAGHRAASCAVPDDERPDQVELLFDRQAPEVGQKSEPARMVERDAPITQIGPVPDLLGDQSDVVEAMIPPEERANDEDCDENGVIEGKNAQGSADIERASAPRRVARVPENACDQETGEDEEEVDTRPAQGRERSTPDVKGHDHSHGDATDAVQGRHLAARNADWRLGCGAVGGGRTHPEPTRLQQVRHASDIYGAWMSRSHGTRGAARGSRRSCCWERRCWAWVRCSIPCFQAIYRANSR